MAEQKRLIAPDTAALRSWRVKLFGWLWRACLVLWSFLFLTVFGGTLANLDTTTIDTPLTKLYIVHMILTYPALIATSVGILALLTLLSWLGGRQRRLIGIGLQGLAEQNRLHMLRRLRARYEQMHAQSLQGVVQIELSLATRPAAVQNAASLVLRLPDQAEQLLPVGTSIVDVYERTQQELLILGEPGAGKSTLLVELALHLLKQAEQDDSCLLPILVPLSTWAAKHATLQEWLSEQIAILYDISRMLSQQWIQQGVFLPLLDGLDEMEAKARPACIAAINCYHRETVRPLVVCSRTNEYTAAANHERLALHTATVVQPLSPEQVESYLKNLGKPLAALRTSLRKNAVLQELATTPLMLHILLLAYHGTVVRELPQKEVLLQEQIWTDYVERMIRRKGDVRRYPLHMTTAKLRWLASQMRQFNQTIFFLDQLEPKWLLESSWSFERSVRASNLYSRIIMLLCGILGILLFGLPVGPFLGLLSGLFVKLLVGLFAGLLAGLLAWIFPIRGSRFERFAGWPFGLFVGLLVTLLGSLLFGLLSSLLFGLLLGLLLGLSFGPFVEDEPDALPGEIGGGIGGGIGCGLFSTLLIGLLATLVAALHSGLFAGLLVGLVTTLVTALITALFVVLSLILQYYIVRFWLAQSSAFPLKAVPFLEDATARNLLRRVGGGYSFIHRQLLDYFADLESETSSTSASPSPAQGDTVE